eukprot:Opistho-1_new@13468
MFRYSSSTRHPAHCRSAPLGVRTRGVRGRGSRKTAPMTDLELVAAGGLTARVGTDGIRISHAGHGDWFGPGSLQVAGARTEIGDHRTIAGVNDLGSWTAQVWMSERGATPRLDLSLCAYEDEPILVFSLRAPTGIDADLATGTFASPSVAWPAFAPLDRESDGLPESASSFGYQYMESHVLCVD